MIEKICKYCGNGFEVYPARVFKQNRGKFCSKKCLAEWQSKNVVGHTKPRFEKRGMTLLRGALINILKTIHF